MNALASSKIDLLIKFGGSISERGTKEQFEQLCKTLQEIYFTLEKFIIIPGGGEFAETVRKNQIKYNFSDETAHWMAIQAMEQYGILIQDCLKRAKMIEIEEEISKITDKAIPILNVINYMKQQSKLEHTWNATSDAIATEVAAYLGIKRIIFLKDIDGVYINNQLQQEVTTNQLEGLENSPFDKITPKLLRENHIKAIIVNGLYPKRIKEFLSKSEIICTEIIYEG